MHCIGALLRARARQYVVCLTCIVRFFPPTLAPFAELRKQIVADDEKLPWYIFKPEAGWRIAWDMMILVLVCYYSLVVPIRIGFDTVACEWRARLIRGGM